MHAVHRLRVGVADSQSIFL